MGQKSTVGSAVPTEPCATVVCVENSDGFAATVVIRLDNQVWPPVEIASVSGLSDG